MSRVAAVTPAALEHVEAPEGVELRALREVADLDGTRFVVPTHSTPEIHAALADAAGLEVVQVLSAGTDWLRVPDGVTLCNARGARDVPVAEWVAGALLGATSGLLADARASSWAHHEVAELRGATVLILGMGSIGAALGARLEAFGARVIGVASRARDGLHGVDELPALLPGADHLVVLAPLSDATRGLVGADALALLPDGAVVVNAARGPVVDTDALVAELRAGRLRAVLDVTDPEPLPDGHPLWELALAVSPHVAGDSPAAFRRAATFAGEQLARWARGEALANVVRPYTGERR